MSNAFRNKGGGHDRNCMVIRNSYAFSDHLFSFLQGRRRKTHPLTQRGHLPEREGPQWVKRVTLTARRSLPFFP